jgi:hypothetical protein
MHSSMRATKEEACTLSLDPTDSRADLVSADVTGLLKARSHYLLRAQTGLASRRLPPR